VRREEEGNALHSGDTFTMRRETKRLESVDEKAREKEEYGVQKAGRRTEDGVQEGRKEEDEEEKPVSRES